MNIDCGIVRDLLPLYAEDICGEETKLAVEKHLKECGDCRARLEDMKASDSTAPVSALPLKAVSKKIKKNQFRLIALAVCAVMFAVAVFAGRSSANVSDGRLPYDPSWKPGAVLSPYSDDLPISVSEDGDGAIVLEYDNTLEIPAIYGYWEGTRYVYYIYFQMVDGETSIQSKQDYPNRNYLTDHGERPASVYYVNPGNQPATRLYGPPKPDEGTIILLPRLALNYYLMIMVAAFLLSGSLAFILRQHAKVRQIMLYISFFTLSYIISHLLIKGVVGANWLLTRDLLFILLASGFAFAAMAFSEIYIRERREGVKEGPDLLLTGRSPRSIRARRISLILFLILFAACVITSYVTQRDPILYADAGQVSAAMGDDGILTITYDIAAKYELEGYVQGNSYVYYLTLYHQGKSPQKTTVIHISDHGSMKPTVYYTYPNEAAVRLYGQADREGEPFFTLPRLALNYYAALMIASLLVIGIISLIAFKLPKFRRVMMYLSFFPLSYIIAHFCIMGAKRSTWFILRDFGFILVTAMFACAVMILAAIQIRARRQAKQETR